MDCKGLEMISKGLKSSLITALLNASYPVLKSKMAAALWWLKWEKTYKKWIKPYINDWKMACKGEKITSKTLKSSSITLLLNALYPVLKF